MLRLYVVWYRLGVIKCKFLVLVKCNLEFFLLSFLVLENELMVIKDGVYNFCFGIIMLKRFLLYILVFYFSWLLF